MIVKEYCRCAARIEKVKIRRSATAQLAKVLGNIAKEYPAYQSDAIGTKTKVDETSKQIGDFRGTPKQEQAG